MDVTIKASNDSADSANIGLASAEDSASFQAGSSQPQNRQATSSGQLVNAENGHHNPKQRMIYLGLFGTSLFCALSGLILLLVWVFKYRPETGLGISSKSQLANLHVLMMYTFMVSLNMYAILIYRTHYSLPKDRLKWTHAIVSGGNIVMSLLGVYAMVKSHWIANLANFYSLHSWIGSLTNAFYLTQFVVGFVAFLRPGLAQHRKAALMPWHKLAGSFILILAAMSALTGILELVIFQDKGEYANFTPITFIANFTGVSIIIMTAITLYLLTAPQYRRPSLPEEQPLKR